MLLERYLGLRKKRLFGLLLVVGAAVPLTFYFSILRPETLFPLTKVQVKRFLKNRGQELRPTIPGEESVGMMVPAVSRRQDKVISDAKVGEHVVTAREVHGSRNLSDAPGEKERADNNTNKRTGQSSIKLSPAFPLTRTQTEKEPPSTFIPDQPDTSPLGRPPDIPKRFLIEEADYCQRRPGLQIIAFVHSSISRDTKRNLTRTTWANASSYNMGDISVNISAVFMVGRAKNDHEQRIIQKESQLYHDIVQGDYGDHYRLLTYKGLAGLYWISRHCAHVPWTLHSDDDTLIDIFLFHRALQELDKKERKKFICSQMSGPVLRTGRWKVRHEEYPAKNYPLYCAGGVWFLQTKFIPQLLETSKSVPYLWVDDVYITGLLAKKAGIGQLPFQKYYGGPKMEKLGRKVAWFINVVSRRVWWDEIVKYHRNHSLHNPVTLLHHSKVTET